MKALLTLIKFQLQAEWRQRFALNGILLYVLSSVFLVQLTLKTVNPPTWNALFWILLGFSAITAIGRSFIQESRGKLLYYYQLVTPQIFILSRMIFNAILMIMVSALSLAVYSLFNGFPVGFSVYYIGFILLAAMGYASVLTMMSAIASKAGNSYLLMPLLSFPVMLPVLLVAVKSSKKAMDGIDASGLLQDMGMLFTLNLFTAALAWILFPYLWKD